MTRKPRQDDPGSWHHVMNRGIAKRAVYENREDVRYFLSRIAYAVRRGEIEIHAFCIMTNHFHLLVRSPKGMLSEAMRRIQNEYVRRFNRMRRRDGALFRGRYRSMLVDSLSYRHTLVCYIDSNPVTAGIVPTPSLYPHASARLYMNASGPPWLGRSWVEQIVRNAAGKESYDPRDYAASFGRLLPAGLASLVELRIAGGRNAADPLDDLVQGAAGEVLSWMKRKANLADGTPPGLAICDPRSVGTALEDKRVEQGSWSIRRGNRSLDAWQHAHVALLRDLSGLGWAQAGRRALCSQSGAVKMYHRHRTLLLEDESYAARVGELADEALLVCGVRQGAGIVGNRS